MRNRLKAWIRYDGAGRVVPGGPILSARKPKVGNWEEIPANLCCNPTTTTTAMPLPLRMTFTDISLVEEMIGSVVNDVTAWNTFFDLPNLGLPFSTVSVSENVVDLYGGGNIYLKDQIFDIASNDFQFGENLLGFEDNDGMIVECGYACFSWYNNNSCSNLVDLNLPNCVKVGDSCFEGCSGIVLPIFNKLKIIGELSFSYCDGLIAPDFSTVEIIGKESFKGDLHLSEPLFNSLITIGEEAFDGCVELIDGHFDSVINIGKGAFAQDELLNCSFPSAITCGDQAFEQCIGMINADFPLLETAGYNCFFGLFYWVPSNLDNLKTAGIQCFCNCLSLITINFPSLVSADTVCFAGCYNLLSIDSPLLESIGDGCFNTCTGLTSLNMPSLTSMGSDVLDNGVFVNISGKTITLTVPIALSTCNAGQPDGDITAFLAANPASTVVYV